MQHVPYITVFADEDGVIWAKDMIDGVESDHFATVDIEAFRQDAKVVMAVTQVLVRMRT